MNKTHHLLQMAERPFAYTESQWLEILSDAECRESYALMGMALWAEYIDGIAKITFGA